MLIHTVAHPGGDGVRPTVIALHGFGAHAQDLLGLQPSLAGGGLLLICPQAPHPIEPGYFGFSWSGASGGGGNPEAIAAAAEAVLAFIDAATAIYPIDPERLVLLGFSQGGVVAARVGLAAPDRFAGLALLSTQTAERSLGTLQAAPGAARLPVLVQHGEHDPQITVAEGRATLERLCALGLQPQYQEYPMGHEISGRSAAELSAWLELVLRLEP